ncbi:MAG: hypothetical protein J1F39_03965 [Clostridiales bacterium]|nr:hypothetical protein [Clostridiales bacterium]
MELDGKMLVSISETQKDFNATKKVADEHGVAIIADGAPKYLLFALTDDEGEKLRKELVGNAAKSVMKKYAKAFEELAK